MNQPNHKQPAAPSNCPNNGELYTNLLAAMTAKELTAALDDALENLTEDSYDPAWMDAWSGRAGLLGSRVRFPGR